MLAMLGDVGGEMLDFGEAGKICLNQERQGACENCLWWEWDAAQHECRNSHGHVCPGYRERLLAWSADRRECRFTGRPEGRRPQVAG